MAGRVAQHRVVATAVSTTRLVRTAIPALFLLVFFAWPVLHMVGVHARPDAVIDAITESSLRGVAWFTLWQAVVSTALSLAVGVPLTWAVSRRGFPGSRVISGLVGSAFLVPAVAMAAGVAALVPSRGIPAILWAHVSFNVAVVLRVVGPTWAMVDTRQQESAASLGAPPWRVFVDVTLPAIGAALRNATALVFAFCFSSFAVVSILGGPTIRTLETEVFTQAVRLGDVGTAVSLSVVQAAVVLIVLSLGRGRPDTLIDSHGSAAERPVGARAHGIGAPMVVAVAASTVVVLPLGAVLVRSVRIDGAWSIAGWRALFDGSLSSAGIDIADVLRTSLVFAVATAGVTLLAAILVCRRRQVGLIEKATLLPLVVSAVTLGLGLVVTFDDPPLDWRGRAWLVPVVHSVIALPLAVRVIGPALRSIGTDLIESARDLGASSLRAWFTVQMPLLRPALLRAAGISGAVSLGEFGATSFLARSDTMTVPIAIGQLMGRPGEILQQAAFALAALTILVTSALLSRA